jgi:hypothetical protein
MMIVRIHLQDLLIIKNIVLMNVADLPLIKEQWKDIMKSGQSKMDLLDIVRNVRLS